jgi:addiction module RelE/StbE family toxin
MKFDIHFVPSADGDLEYYEVREQRIILDAIEKFLETDADIESKRRKRLQSDQKGPWELKVGDYRVFYKIVEEKMVRVVAVGHKVHNDLYIRGKKVEI